MYKFSDPNITVASHEDISSIRDLLNSAYRGESSKQGWTTEAHLIAGDVRTDEQTVADVMNKEGSVFLKYSENDGKMIACVNLQRHGDMVYLGMFSVSPGLQGRGIGKKLLQASEEYARSQECSSIYMSVISVRDELIGWYKRNGYVDTGKRQPFIEDAVTGRHLQPLEFMIMQKTL